MQKINILATVKEAWQLISGTKQQFCLGAVLAGLVAMVIVLLRLAFNDHYAWFFSHHALLQYIDNMFWQLFLFFMVAPFFTGLYMLAIRRARGEKNLAGVALNYFKNWRTTGVITVIRHFLVSLVWLLFSAVIFLLSLHGYVASDTTLIKLLNPLVITLTGLAVFAVLLVMEFFIFARPLVVERRLSLLGAIRASFAYVKQHWVSLLLLQLIKAGLGFGFVALLMIKLTLANSIMVALLLLSGFWLLPFYFLLSGVAYRQVVDA